MRIRVLLGTAIAGFVLLALTACQGDFTEPDLTAPTDGVYAHGEPGPGGGGGGGGGNGGGPPDSDMKKGDMYADLVYLLRDVYGRPLIQSYTVIDPETGDETTYRCVQPISNDPLPGIEEAVTNPVDGQEVYLIPLVGYGDTEVAVAAEEEESDELAPCDIDPAYVDYPEEVPFGRLNLGRSPDRVLNQALREASGKLDDWQAAGFLALDHAGRFMNTDPVLVEETTIDAPAENLAIHRELQIRGTEWKPFLPVHPGVTGTDGFLDNAASGLSGAVDKGGYISPDMIVYNNRILGIPESTHAMATLGADIGVAGEEGQLYIDYSGYSYDRAATFPGCAVWWTVVGDEATRHEATILDAVFGGVGFTGSNIAGFARRADDARAVIQFAHDNVVTELDAIGESETCTVAP